LKLLATNNCCTTEQVLHGRNYSWFTNSEHALAAFVLDSMFMIAHTTQEKMSDSKELKNRSRNKGEYKDVVNMAAGVHEN
jgi:hypothetical protein